MQFQGLNAVFLTHGSSNLEVLGKMMNDPDAAAMQAKDFLGRLEKLKMIDAGEGDQAEDEETNRVRETPTNTYDDQDLAVWLGVRDAFRNWVLTAA